MSRAARSNCRMIPAVSKMRTAFRKGTEFQADRSTFLTETSLPWRTLHLGMGREGLVAPQVIGCRRTRDRLDSGTFIPQRRNCLPWMTRRLRRPHPLSTQVICTTPTLWSGFQVVHCLLLQLNFLLDSFLHLCVVSVVQLEDVQGEPKD